MPRIKPLTISSPICVVTVDGDLTPGIECKRLMALPTTLEILLYKSPALLSKPPVIPSTIAIPTLIPAALISPA